jgi:hypothetical protein
MRNVQTIFFATLLVVLPAAGRLDAATTIVVHFGQHGSAEQAARSEAQVNWTDADTTADTICTQSFAAVELQHYLRKIVGRNDDFAIAGDDSTPSGDLILVGGPTSNRVSRSLQSRLPVDAQQLADLGPEGYWIRTAGDGQRRLLLLVGGGRVGTLYAVYGLLDRLGCRWFAPGEAEEEVPHAKWSFAGSYVERPHFRVRGFHAWEDRATPEFLVWMARNRLNYWCVEQQQHALMHKLGIRMVGGSHDAQARFLNPTAPYPYGPAQHSKDPYAPSPQRQGDANRDGKLSYFEAHPEWYAFDGKRRIPGIQGEFGTNYCTSNADATTEFMKNYVQSLVDGVYRDAQIVRFWTLDAARWCRCDACQAQGSPTDRNLQLVAGLDAEIKRAQAAGRISRPIAILFLAYADVLDPPSHALPAEFDYATCQATFYPICRCYVHNFDDPACPVNARYCRQLAGWATAPNRHYRGQIAIGEYYNVSGYRSLPICFMHTMAHDIPYYYHQAGARQFDYMHVTTDRWGPKALTNYQMARQIWNVQTNCPALWDDYFRRRYGPAADNMRGFYESLERMLSNATELKYGLARRLAIGAPDLFPTSHLRYRHESGVTCDGPTLLEIVEHGRQCRKRIDESLRGELPPRIRQRIAEDERCFTYAERTIGYFHACADAYQLGRTGQRAEARRRYAEARRLADQLREDRTSVALCYGDPAIGDALAASYAAGALKQLAKLLGEQPSP